LGTGTDSVPGGGVWRCIHSRHAAMTMELTGIPVRAAAWSRRANISSEKRTVVARAMMSIRYHIAIDVNSRKSES